jgi:hypothetical protein
MRLLIVRTFQLQPNHQNKFDARSLTLQFLTDAHRVSSLREKFGQLFQVDLDSQ